MKSKGDQALTFISIARGAFLALAIVSIFFVLALIGGCATAKADSQWHQAQSLHSELLAKFTLVDQSEVDRVVRWTGHEPEFFGDCDDYAYAAYNRMRELGWPVYGVYAKFKKTGVRHVMACYEGASGKPVCLDNTFKFILKWREVKKHYAILKMVKEGE